MSDYEYYIQQLGGPNEDNAFHSLIEADSAVIPDLVAAYRLEVSPRKRAVLIEIIRYHRETASVDFLADALQEKEPDIWKAALDALVTINHPTALNALLGARADFKASGDTVRLEWVGEAIQQLHENLGRTD